MKSKALQVIAKYYFMVKIIKGSSTILSFYASVQRVLFFLPSSSYPKTYCINVDDTYGYTVSQETKFNTFINAIQC